MPAECTTIPSSQLQRFAAAEQRFCADVDAARDRFLAAMRELRVNAAPQVDDEFDGLTLRWGGAEIVFRTKMQRAIVATLWEHWRRFPGQALSTEELMNRASPNIMVERLRVDRYFMIRERGRRARCHEAFGSVIQRLPGGFYRLAVDQLPKKSPARARVVPGPRDISLRGK